jgi:hypothetical protein
MICTRCYESNVQGGVSPPIVRTNLTGVVLLLAWLGLPALSYPTIFVTVRNPYSGEMVIRPSNDATLWVAIAIELLLLIAVFVIGRSRLCSACHGDALIPRNSVRGRQIQAEQPPPAPK